MAFSGSRLILQSDWDSALIKEDDKVWVTFKSSADVAGVHGDLKCSGMSSAGVPYVTGSGDFSVQSIGKKTITVTHKIQDLSYTQLFVAPQISFSTIHTINKPILCCDVTSGGLGISSDNRGKLLVWQTNTGEIRRNLTGHVGDVYVCRFFPSGVVALTSGSDMQIKIWSVETGQCAATIIGHHAAVLDLAVVDRGRNIISASKDGTAKLWDVGQQKCLATMESDAGEVNCCALQETSCVDLGPLPETLDEREVNTQGKLLLLGCQNNRFQAYGLQSRQKVFEMDTHSAVNCCCSLSDTSAVFGMQDGHMTIVDYRNPRVPLKEWKDSRGPFHSVCPFKGGFFACSGDGSCFYMNSHLDTCVEFTGSDCDPIYKVCHDGGHLYTCCRDGIIYKYSLSLAGLL